MTKESDIVYESEILYVFRVNKARYEIRKTGTTHAIIIGWGSDKDKVIRCAKRLELYPKNLDHVYGNSDSDNRF